MLRRRGWGRRARGPLEKLQGMRGVGLRDPEAVGPEDATPAGVELGAAWLDQRRVALVAASRGGEDLIGWARVAAQLASEDGSLTEAVVVAPLHGPLTRALAAAAGARGLRVTLLSVPALSDAVDDLVGRETLPDDAGRPGDDAASLYARLCRVLEGAAAVTSSGGLRATSSGAALYLRGAPVARLTRDGAGVAVSFLMPDRHRVFVEESSFPRWGVELHEKVVQLAQDARLAEAAEHDRAVEGAASDAGIAICSRWIPCSPDGESFVDFAGLDAAGRPVVALVRGTASLADVASLATAQLRLAAEPGLWVPEAPAIARALVIAGALDGEVDTVLTGLTVEVAEPSSIGRPLARTPRPPRSRRRGRGDTPEVPREPAQSTPRAAEPETPERDDDWDGDDEGARDRRPRRRRRRRRGRGAAAADGDSEGDPDPDPDERDDDGDPGERRALARPEPRDTDRAQARNRADRDEDDGADDEGDGVSEAEPEAREASSGRDEAATAPEAVAADDDDDDDDDDVEVIAEEPEQEEVPEPPRRRHSRATVVTRDDPDAVLAALVLARDRRTITSFRVLRQDDLLDYLKGPANDVPEAEDLLLVGFEAQPHARELVGIAELFRGRLQWFDHHRWAIEDVEGLRAAIGRESVLVEEAATPLHSVNQVTERRSRFTDKLVELSGRRLSENDMEKWGYRVIGLIERLVRSPGEQRSQISGVLSGKPGELPRAEQVFREEARWVEENDPRMVHFGEYELAVFEVPEALDPGEVARRVRQSTGARLSLGTRAGDDLVILACNDEKQPLNVTGVAELLGSSQPWAHSRISGDRVGRVWVDDRSEHPERLEAVISEIVRQRSVLYG